jgi:hypothetical protein
MTLLGAAVTLTALGAVAGGSVARGRSDPPFFETLAQPRQVSSTVPLNGDVNPYGVAIVPDTIGTLVKGDTLVSNFNDKANVQGTGTTIVEVSPAGVEQTFATVGSPPGSDTCKGGIGFTTALSILPGGWVVVGSLPTGAGGDLPSVNPAGCLIVLNDAGDVAETWSTTNINGPWDMIALLTHSGAYLFVPDPPDKSTCYGTCAAYWPPVTGTPIAGTGVTGKLGTIRRTGGGNQVTYDGHPLYTYVGDPGPGQANGNNINLNGGLWREIVVRG